MTARAAGAIADTLGLGGVHADPTWRTVTELTALETDLLRTWPVRRLGLVAHAGAVSLVTTQTYSRLEHSLGLLGLVAHVDASDRVARAAALLHDVGHLPLSHTLEGLRGLHHHAQGVAHVRGLHAVLRRHGVEVDDVLATLSGERPSSITPSPGLLSLDHLDSYVRSGIAHGRLTESPRALLDRVRVVGGVVETDAATAETFGALVADEVGFHCSPVNILATGVVRHLGSLLIEAHPDPAGRAATVAAMTDGELLAALLQSPVTRTAARQLLSDPLAWTVLAPGEIPADGVPGSAIRYEINHLYVAQPLVDGRPHLARPRDDTWPSVPATYWIVPATARGHRPGASRHRPGS